MDIVSPVHHFNPSTQYTAIESMLNKYMTQWILPRSQEIYSSYPKFTEETYREQFTD